MPRTSAPYFVSCTQNDMQRVEDLLARLAPHLAASKRYAFEKWKFTDLLIGERWNEAILKALERHRIALLMISPMFLIRPYIIAEELPRLLVPGKVVLPVLLKPIDPQRQEMHSLDVLQIFATRVDNERRAYSECRADQRDAFVFELYKAIEDRLDRDL